MPRIVHHSRVPTEQNYFIDTMVLPTIEAIVSDGEESLDVDVDIISITISNAGGQASPAFTIKDRQATPQVFEFGANTIVSVGEAVSFDPGPGKRATGGLTWVQDTAGALVGKIEYRK